MPVYCFRTVKGKELVELPLSVAEKERIGDEITLGDGRKARRDFMAEHTSTRPSVGIWPMYSEAAGVHPSQIAETRETAAKRGVPTDFTSDGRVIFTSRKHRKEFCEKFGMYDRNGGYGDPQRN